MGYRDRIKKEMDWLSLQDKVVFIGEGLKNGGDIYGTLIDVPAKKCLEMPVAENLIMGTAIGLALDGWTPIVVFQRMDFMLIAADAIINHLSLISKLSGGQYNPKVLIRAIVGSQKKEFWVGEQHNHNFTDLFDQYLTTVSFSSGVYKRALDWDGPVLIVEEKDAY